MNNRELIRKIKLLKEIQPRPDWQITNREILLNQISQNQEISQPAINGSDFNYYFRFFIPRFFHNLAQPVGVVILISALILGGSIVTVSASQSSLPGDYLYSVKITGEKVQTTLLTNPQDKLALEIKFANRRLAEIQQVNQGTESTDQKRLRVTKAADALTQNLKNIQNNLKTIQNQEGSGDKVVAAATLVDEQVGQLNQGVEKEIVPTTEVKGLIDETFNQTLDVWIDQYQNGQLDYRAKQDILNKVTVKIDQTGEKVRLILNELEKISNQEIIGQSTVTTGGLSTESEEKTETVASAQVLPTKEEVVQQLTEVEKLLAEARKAMIISDVVLAVDKLKQSKDKIVVAEQWISKIKQALIQAAETNKEPVEKPTSEEIASTTATNVSDISDVEAVVEE